MRGSVLVVLLPLLSGCTGGATPPPVAARPAATSADGTYSLRVRWMSWLNWPGQMGGPTLNLRVDLDDLAPGTLVAAGNPWRELVTPDGVRRPMHADRSEVDAAAGTFVARDVEIGRGPQRLALLTLEVPLLHVRTWEAFAVTIEEVRMPVELEAPPFHLRFDPASDACIVSASGERPDFPGAEWAEGAVEILDATGVRLAGGLGGRAGSFTRPPSPEDTHRPDLAFPLKATLRVPKEYEVERVAFAFRDIALPPRPAPIPCVIETLPGANPDPPPEPDPERSWSAWSEPAGGLFFRASLPTLVRRGGSLPAGLALRVDPAALAPGTRFFDGRDLEDRVRLRFRNRETGATLDLRLRDEEKVLETPVIEDGAPEPDPGKPEKEPPDWLPLRDAQDREWTFPFRLASVWDQVPPANWEVLVALAPPQGRTDPDTWSGTVATPPLPLVVEEAAPRHLRVRVPTALRAGKGLVRGAVDITCDPAETEVLDLEQRRGFGLGTRVMCSEASHFTQEFEPEGESVVLQAADRLDPEESGPLDRTYELEIYESAPRSEPIWEIVPGRNGYRTLWKRSFRVKATAAEIEALRR